MTTMTQDEQARAWETPHGYRFDIPPFPNCWFQVAYSDELEPNAVMPLQYFGKDLVLFRGEDGKARVLDAFCPHLGAHLGYGGLVRENTIRCPFHAWRFDGEGRCVDVPYANKIPPLAKLDAWPVCEVNGLIVVWHHMEGRPPAFELPVLPEYGNPPGRRTRSSAGRSARTTRRWLRTPLTPRTSSTYTARRSSR